MERKAEALIGPNLLAALGVPFEKDVSLLNGIFFNLSYCVIGRLGVR